MDIFGRSQSEEIKHGEEEPRSLMRASTCFSLKNSHSHGEDPNNISITLDELDTLNEKHDMSSSILDFTLQCDLA